MKATILSSVITAALALPLANAWRLEACSQIFSGSITDRCTTLSCAAGETVDFSTGTPGGPIEMTLYSDASCTDEITHFADDEVDYILPQRMQSFRVLA